MIDIKSWTSNIEQDEHGDLFIVLPPEICSDLDWIPGDTLLWIVNEDKSVILKKKLNND
jgi:hypothetical protein